MKNIKLLVLIICCVVLVGCGSSQGSKEEKDTFTVGMECSYAPFNWQTNTQTDTSISMGGAGYADGYDVMIAKQIADDLGKELVIKKISWDGLQPALNSGTIDAIIAGMTATPERENGVDFTSAYYESEMVMIVRKDDVAASFKDIQQFSGKNIVGQKSTSYDEVIDQINGVKHMTPKANYPEMVTALQQKEADGITAELPVAKGIIASNPNLTYVTFEKGKGFDIDTSVSIGLKDGTKDSEFFKAVQKSLDSISKEEREKMMEKARASVPSTMQ